MSEPQQTICWTCPNCEAVPQFTPEEFMRHLREVHNVTEMRGTRAFTLHMNCADRHVYGYEWTIGALKFQQSVVSLKRNVRRTGKGRKGE